MEFHTSKCEVISITNKVTPIIGKYQIHDHFLEQVHCAKYLGIYIDSKLAFDAHVDAIVKERRMQPARGRFARFDLDRQIASTFPAHWKVGPAPVFLGQPAIGTRRVAGTTHTESGRR